MTAPLSLGEHIAAVTEVCFAIDVPEDQLARLGAEDRWRSYRKMVRTRLRKVVRAALPRTTRACAKHFDSVFSQWLAQKPPSTRYFREVPVQFQEFASPQLTEIESWLAELAEFEIACWTSRYSDERTAPAIGELSFERPIVLHPSVRLLQFNFGVHHSPGDKRRNYTQGPHRLCVYRNKEFESVTMQLNPLAYDLMMAWRGPETLAEATQSVARKRDTKVDDQFIDGLSTMLEDFIERGIVMGSRA